MSEEGAYKETSEEALAGTPERPEDHIVPEEAVAEAAEATGEESRSEAVNPEGEGADSQDPGTV